MPVRTFWQAYLFIRNSLLDSNIKVCVFVLRLFDFQKFFVKFGKVIG